VTHKEDTARHLTGKVEIKRKKKEKKRKKKRDISMSLLTSLKNQTEV
jgi:hypothetical protein